MKQKRDDRAGNGHASPGKGLGPLAAIVALASMLAGSPAWATDYHWNVTSGAFTEATNWDSGTVPGTSDAAFVNNGGTAYITDETVNVFNVQCNLGSVVISGESVVTTNNSW
jgi:hypothetical protein